LLKVGAGVTTKLPKLGCGTLVMKDHVVKFEGIDFSSVELAKALADVLQKGQELLLVVTAIASLAASRRARSARRSD
jgi:hypothetical protein